ncbi:MAG: hypothetical protein ABFC77_00030 [Thermoguttaceae bacterium]
MRLVSWVAAVFLGLLVTVAYAQNDHPQKDVAPASPRQTVKSGAAAVPSSVARREDPFKKILDRIGKLPPADQQEWLRRLEHRAMRAAELSLSADEAARQQAKIRDQLHRGLVTWQTLRDVIETTDSRERDAISQRVRQYRTMVFDAFHGRQKELGERQQAWFDVYLAWKTAGSQFEQQERLIDWLDKAIRGVSPNTTGPLPEPPTFEPEQTAESSSPVKPSAKSEPGKAAQGTVDRTGSHAGKSTTPRAEAPRLSEGSPTEKPLMAAGEVAMGAVEIKVDELGARVSGFNLALRGLESELDEQGVWNAERLVTEVDQLKLLTVRRNDLRLFRDALPKNQRASVDKIESLKSVVSSLAARIAEVRKYLKGDEFKGTDEERQDDLDRLDSLSRQLAEIAEK